MIFEAGNFKKAVVKFLLIILASLQILLGSLLLKQKPDFYFQFEAPSDFEIELLSGGDKEFFYRKMLFLLQFGALDEDANLRFLPNWLNSLENLDKNSAFLPFISVFYYANTQNKHDIKQIAEFVISYDFANIEKKMAANLLANANMLILNKLEDYKTSFANFVKFRDMQTLPVQFRLMGLFIAFNNGKFCDVLIFSKPFSYNAFNVLAEEEKTMSIMNLIVNSANEKIKISKTKCKN